MDDKKSNSNTQILAAIIGATAICIAAIIGILQPIVSRWVDNNFPTNTPLASASVVSETPIFIPNNAPMEIPTNTGSPTLIPTTNPIATVQQVLPTFQPVLENTPTLQPPWDILLNDWQDSKILKQSGDKTAIAVGTFIFKVISSKGNYCGIVTSGSTLDSVKEFNTPLLEYYPTTRNNLLIYLTMSDGKNNDSYDMEDFCLDPPGYTFVIMHETNGIIAMQRMELPIPSAP
jgi:hypothetical protein